MFNNTYQNITHTILIPDKGVLQKYDGQIVFDTIENAQIDSLDFRKLTNTFTAYGGFIRFTDISPAQDPVL